MWRRTMITQKLCCSASSFTIPPLQTINDPRQLLPHPITMIIQFARCLREDFPRWQITWVGVGENLERQTLPWNCALKSRRAYSELETRWIFSDWVIPRGKAIAFSLSTSDPSNRNFFSFTFHLIVDLFFSRILFITSSESAQPDRKVLRRIKSLDNLPRLHMSIGVPYDRPRMTSGDR